MNESEAAASLYERDVLLWMREQAQLLRAGRFEQLDIPNLVEEIEGLSGSQRTERANRLYRLLLHLLKLRYQPEAQSSSWLGMIAEQRKGLRKLLRQSPSLRRDLLDDARDEYADARLGAARETGLPLDAFPAALPFTVEELLEE